MKYLFAGFLIFSSAQISAQDSETKLVQVAAYSFLNSIMNMDFNAAKEFSTDNTAKMLDMMSELSADMPDSIKNEARKIKYEVTEVNIEKDKAVIKFYGSDQPDRIEEMPLVKQNGRWLVDMDIPIISEPITPNNN